MGSVYKRSRVNRAGQTVKAAKWTISYTDERGQTKVEPGFRDKRASEEKLRQIMERVDRLRVGLPVETEAQLTMLAAQAIAAYVADMRRRGLSDVHWKEAKRHLETMQLRCSWKVLADLKADSLTAFLGRLQALGRAAGTVNRYRDHAATFCGWCIDQGWLATNPAARVPKAKKGAKVKPRRAYTTAEFHAMLKAAGTHRLLYLTAGLSGLRRRELRRLEKRDLTPIGKQPTWHLRPEATKGKRRDVVPILAELLPELRAHWESLPEPTSRVFPKIPRTRTHHKHLSHAKVQRLDGEGRCLDFHSFRLFFCTLLAKKLPIQTVRFLMRHRDIRETCNVYLDLGLTDVQEEMLKLPAILEMTAPAEAAANGAATGAANDGGKAVSPIGARGFEPPTS